MIVAIIEIKGNGVSMYFVDFHGIFVLAMFPIIILGKFIGMHNYFNVRFKE